MDKIKLAEKIKQSNLVYNSLYEKINVVDKEKTDFDFLYYNEIVYMALFLFHLKYGIKNLSKKTAIPDILGNVDSYDTFKLKLSQYKEIEFHHDILTDETNLFQEIWRLAKDKLLQSDFSWTKIYSSSIYNKNIMEDGKLYISIDNKDLYQFACLLLTNCLKRGMKDFEFKVNNDPSINRTDNLVVYFTKDNLNIYLEIINNLKIAYPDILINQEHLLGEKLSDGVVIAKDYKDGSSFTEKVCKSIIKLADHGYDINTIVNLLENSINTHLIPVLSLISDETLKKNK